MGDISKNYSLVEFTRSRRAIELGLDNTPPASAVANIKSLVNVILQPINDATGWINIVSSGYRSREVNSVVGGVDNSDHRKGLAADCHWYKKANGKWQKLQPNVVIDKINELGLPYKQIIAYSKEGFVHIAYGGGNQVIPEDKTDGADIQMEYPETELTTQYSKFSVPSNLLGTKREVEDDSEDDTVETEEDKDDENVPMADLEEYFKKFAVMKPQGAGDKEEVDPKWLEFSDGSRTNFDRIVEKYTPEEKVKYKKEIEEKKPTFVKVGTELLCTSDRLKAIRETLENSNVFHVPGTTASFGAYWSQKIKELTSDPNYVPFFYGKDGGEFVQQKVLNAKVWVYSYAKDCIYDITPFIMSIQTQKQFKSGSFTINVSPVQGDGGTRFPNSGFVWQFRNSFIKKQSRQKYHTIIDWFNMTFQMNDIVFIRFEELNVENKYRVGSSGGKVKAGDTEIVPPNDLTKDLCWDMIGAIDTISSTASYESNDYSVSIVGRDFMKFFEDDGVNFLPQQFIFGSTDNFMINANSSSDGAFLERNNAGEFFFMNSFQTIKSMLGFIFERLTSMTVVRKYTQLFDASSRSGNDNGNVDNKRKIEGIWKIFRVWVEDSLSDRVLVNQALINPNGNLINFLNSVCQEPFVEYFGDTWGAGYDLFVRRPPFDRESISRCLPSLQNLQYGSVTQFGMRIANKDLLGHNLSFDKRAYSWYRIVPSNGLFDGVESLSYSMYPIFYMDEFVEHFGNKRCEVQDSYLHSAYLGGIEKEDNKKDVYAKIASDYLYVIQSTIYLPFTRTGTITINGDRRVKVGTFIILDATNELFYVTGVTQNIVFNQGSVDRLTTINVERGMRLDIWEKYFEIVNLKELENHLKECIKKAGDNSETKEKPEMVTIVNEEVLDYFLSRWQFGIPYVSAEAYAGNLKEVQDLEL